MFEHFWQVVLLSIVEGITEFLPISSTAHLILFGGVLEVEKDFDILFPIVCQLGAIFAVVVIYWHRFRALLPWHPSFWHPSAPLEEPGPNASGQAESRPENSCEDLQILPDGGFNAVLCLGFATLPALIVGFFLDDLFETIFKSPIVIAGALGIGGMVIILFEGSLSRRKSSNTQDTDQRIQEDGEILREKRRSTNNTSYKRKNRVLSLPVWVKLGMFQTIAIIPGVSRSGATIIGGMSIGLTREQVTLASFFMAVPVLCAASIYKLLTNYHLLSSRMLIDLGLGVLFSFLVAIVAIRWLLNYIIRKDSFTIFGWYRIALAMAIIMWSNFS